MTSPFADAFDQLEPGATFTTRGRTLTEADVVSFASLTGDFHPQHTDAEWARSSRFGERVAHGMLVLSYAVGLVPLDAARVVALRRISDAVFKRPARIGDTIHVEGRIESLRDVDAETGLVGWRWTVVDQHGQTLARATIDVLWRRDEAEGTPPRPSAADRRPALDILAAGALARSDASVLPL